MPFFAMASRFPPIEDVRMMHQIPNTYMVRNFLRAHLRKLDWSWLEETPIRIWFVVTTVGAEEGRQVQTRWTISYQLHTKS